MAGLEDRSPAEAFAWLLAPLTEQQFFERHWEKCPLHLRGADAGRFRGLLSQRVIESRLASKPGLIYGKDINLARCGANGEQIMCNGTGRAGAEAVQKKVREGCSVQVVHPQRFGSEVACLLSKLESHFGCLWGANSFRTPPGGKGFKAHHDEVEVFMLQLEGAKRWRLHRCPEGPLPRSYCWDYEGKDLGEPLMELVLQPGDLLYLPRGTIHQGEAVEGHPSHHLTISTYQRHSWADFLEKALPEALARASQQPGDSLFREGLPLRCWSYLGEQHQGNSPARDAFQAQLRARLLALAEHLAPAADAAGDVLAAQLVARRLPPPAPRSAAAAAAALDEAAEAEDPAVRWADPLAVRVVVEKGPTGEEIQIYHSRENGAAGHMQADVEPEPACIVLEGLEFLPALQALNNACGKWILASSVDPDLVEGLMEHGLLELGDSRLCDLAPSGRPPRRRPRRRGATGRSAGGGVAGKAAAPSAGSKTKRPRRSVGKKDDAGEHRRHGEAVEKQRSAIM